jgi:cold shock CspA family protein
MLSGTITQLVADRRFGYVRPTTGGVPLLFMAVAVEAVLFDELVEGQAVTYTLVRDPLGRGPRATHVRPVAAAPAAAAAAE